MSARGVINKKVKFGAYCYSTENIGDEIQTLAALRFLPQVDYWFDRDQIDECATGDSEIKLIMNGWYMHPVNGKFMWPPKNTSIQPLLISLHVDYGDKKNKTSKAFFSPEGLDFLNKNGLVGARDLTTLNLLEKHGISAYFSGCLSLTLLPNPAVKKQNFILAVDVSDKIYEAIKQKADRPIIRLNTNHASDLPNSQKLSLARYWLFLYQSAHAVVTTRLHTMLPCLALGTPVLAIEQKDKRRYAGLIDLTYHTTEQKVINNEYAYDFDNPPENPRDYKDIAAELVKRCHEFTGYDSERSFVDIPSVNRPGFVELVATLTESSHQYYRLQQDYQWLLTQARKGEKSMWELKQLNQSLEYKIHELEGVISELKNPGIRNSAKNLKRAVKRRLKRG